MKRYRYLRQLQNCNFATATAEKRMFRRTESPRPLGEKLQSQCKTNRVLQLAHLFAVCLLFVFPVLLSAQTARTIEGLLETEAVTNQQAAWLVLEAADAGIPTQAGAFRFAAEQGWLPDNAVPNGQATLDEVSLLIMQAFDISGGMFFRLFGTPHYAYRELVHMGIIQGRTTPRMAVSGELLLFMINRVYSRLEAEQTAQEGS